jgi:ABC-2 type transport system ATP-binding protein
MRPGGPGRGRGPAGGRLLPHEGRTILISSHVLSKVAQTVDQVVIINQGRLRFAGPLGDLGDLEASFLRLTDATTNL